MSLSPWSVDENMKYSLRVLDEGWISKILSHSMTKLQKLGLLPIIKNILMGSIQGYLHNDFCCFLLIFNNTIKLSINTWSIHGYQIFQLFVLRNFPLIAVLSTKFYVKYLTYIIFDLSKFSVPSFWLVKVFSSIFQLRNPEKLFRSCSLPVMYRT